MPKGAPAESGASASVLREAIAPQCSPGHRNTASSFREYGRFREGHERHGVTGREQRVMQAVPKETERQKRIRRELTGPDGRTTQSRYADA
jgi:hypothetical protein